MSMGNDQDFDSGRRKGEKYLSDLQRRRSETVIPKIKRDPGCELPARSHWPQCREMALLVIVRGAMILL